MFGLRQKLAMGFGGLLLILLGVSTLGIVVIYDLRYSLDKFLNENWRSVLYGQKMVDNLELLDDGAKILADPRATAEQTSAAGALADQCIKEFNDNLDAENHNITIHPEEDLYASQLSRDWRGAEGYQGYEQAYEALRKSTAPAQRQKAYAAIQAISPNVKKDAHKIIQLNSDNMTTVSDQMKVNSYHASHWMFFLDGIGAALAVLLVAAMGRAIIQPLGTLTRSARLIEEGNLDLVVQVKSHDELRQLAEAFNSMAAKLREYRRTNQAKFLRTQATTQNAIDSLPDAVAILGPGGAVEMANRTAQRLFGLQSDTPPNPVHAQWLSSLYEQTSRDLRPVEPHGYESAIQVLDENGGERFFLPRAVPITDPDRRQLLGVTVVLADVTHLRRLDEMKSGMLSVVSHELKTPLTSIRMGVHLLLEERIGPLTAEQSDILTAVGEDSDRLHRIVENLLDMTRIESGRALLDLKSESAQHLIDEAVESMRAAFSERGVELKVTVAADTPPALADRNRINHVFSNLLSNALRYTPPGGHVEVDAQAQDNGVLFSVSDTGPGIPPQFQSRIFERFFRVPGQTNSGGAGLGLAIAKDIVEAHDGKIFVHSQPGSGSQFSFWLPQGPDAAPEAGNEAGTPSDRG